MSSPRRLQSPRNRSPCAPHFLQPDYMAGRRKEGGGKGRPGDRQRITKARSYLQVALRLCIASVALQCVCVVLHLAGRPEREECASANFQPASNLSVQ